MKIELKMNNDTLVSIHRLLENLYMLNLSVITQENVYKSIGFDLAEKFEKKLKTRIKNATLFDAKKKIKISLKTHEAWALKEIAVNLITTIDAPFQQNQLQKLINTLDQKLA